CSNLISENNHSQLVVHVSRDLSFESLPRSSVFNKTMPANLSECPSKTVRLGFAVVELHRRPHLFERRLFQKLFGVECCIPLRHVIDREIKSAVGGRVQWRRNPVLVFELTVYDEISRSTIRNDIGFTDDARRRHLERFE